MPKIVTRFAPSPTGFLHVGGLRTALYNFLYAKKHHGKFLLRIEDTDQTRKVEGAVENLFKTLKTFNIEWDNDPAMIQSERLAMYQKTADQLISAGHAYHCFCTKERLENLKTVQMQKGLPPMYDGQCRTVTDEDAKKRISAGEQAVVRFKVPRTGITEFIDLVRGRVSFDNKILDDQIIIKSDGFPTYHLASVVDDHEMEVTHVIRGEEWLPSTPKHLLLYTALGWNAPQFAHLPLLLNPDRSKLSKRQGDVACEDYLQHGYLPEALLNFIVLLGWNPGTDQELFTSDEMVAAFSLEHVNKSGAVFNTQKLDWLNGYYIRTLSAKELAIRAKPFFDKENISVTDDFLEKVVVTEQQRIKRLEEIVEATRFFFEQPVYDAELLIWKKDTKDVVTKNLNYCREILISLKKSWDTYGIESTLKSMIEEKKLDNGSVLWPLRVALSGRKASPGPFEIAGVLGQTESIKRIEFALKMLEK